MERYKSQEDHGRRTGLYEIGAIHVVVILPWIVWRDDVT